VRRQSEQSTSNCKDHFFLYFLQSVKCTAIQLLTCGANCPAGVTHSYAEARGSLPARHLCPTPAYSSNVTDKRHLFKSPVPRDISVTDQGGTHDAGYSMRRPKCDIMHSDINLATFFPQMKRADYQNRWLISTTEYIS